MKSTPYITALGNAIGQELELEFDGSLALNLSGVPMLIHWQEEAEAFLLHMDIGLPTTMGGGAVFSQLLGANFLLSETKGTTLSLNELSGMASLESLVFTSGLDGNEFVARVERFVEQVDVWTARLKEWNQAIEDRIEASLEALDNQIESELQGDNSPSMANTPRGGIQNFEGLLKV